MPFGPYKLVLDHGSRKYQFIRLSNSKIFLKCCGTYLYDVHGDYELNKHEINLSPKLIFGTKLDN